MGAAIAAFIVLTFTALVFGGFRRLVYWISGALTPLDAPGGVTATGPSMPAHFQHGTMASGSTPAAFEAHRDGICECHGHRYSAIMLFDLVRPPHWADLAVGPSGERVSGQCLLLGCDACVGEARRYRAFHWTRKNQPDHPSWASASLYPWLLKTQYFRMAKDFAMPWIPDAAVPDVPPGLEDGGWLRPLVDELAAANPAVTVAPRISASLRRAVLMRVNTALTTESGLPDDDVFVAADSGGATAIVSGGLHDGGTGGAGFVPWSAMDKIVLSPSGCDVSVNGKKVTNPFFKQEKQRRYARAFLAVLEPMRDARRSA
ncbi:MAG: hypothetical protein ABI634_20415 [Acidobacteriota bacterium]